jgi:hypothetical protein
MGICQEKISGGEFTTEDTAGTEENERRSDGKTTPTPAANPRPTLA